eukprot:1155839-Pleurochrysis_carterae.AAC.3
MTESIQNFIVEGEAVSMHMREHWHNPARAEVLFAGVRVQTCSNTKGGEVGSGASVRDDARGRERTGVSAQE